MFEILSKLFLSVIAADICLLSSQPNCSSALINSFASNPESVAIYKEVPTECNKLNECPRYCYAFDSIYWNASSVIES